MNVRPYLLPLIAGILLAAPTAAHAIPFGPNLANLTANNPYTCGNAGGWSGCTAQDPMYLDMENVLPDPIAHGNQTGVVTDVHVLSAVTTHAQFVIVEWSGQPGLGQPFPSGVMALSQTVTLHPGINSFNSNLPVDFRLAPNGFESWSEIALTILDPTSPIPAQLGGATATTGLLFDNGNPLTQVTQDLTLPPHNVAIGGFPPATLLMSGDVTITTGQTPPPPPTPPPTPPTPPSAQPKLTLPATVPLRRDGTATIPLQCAAGASCTGTLSIRNHATAVWHHKRALTYGNASFSIPAGATRSVKLALTRAGKRTIGHRRTLHAYLVATFTRGGATAAAPITLTRQKTSG